METNEWRWVVRPVKDAISDAVTELRCKDCHGAVKLPDTLVASVGAAAAAETAAATAAAGITAAEKSAGRTRATAAVAKDAA